MLSAVSNSRQERGDRFFVADLGGTYLRCAFAAGGADLTSVARYRLNGEVGERGDELWDEVVANIHTYCRSNEVLAGRKAPLIFAFPGPVANGRAVCGAPTLVGRAMVPDLAAILAEALQREVIILNDVSAAAWYFAQKLQCDRFAVVTISSGIGAKLFDRRHPHGVFDELPYAGEIGHLVVDRTPDAPICGCGGRGHLGSVASGHGIERSARRLALLEPEQFAASACSTLFGALASSLNNEQHLVPAALIGDSWALGVIRETARPLATVLLTLVVGAGLEQIVFMGGFAQRLGNRYLSAVRTALRETADAGPAECDVEGMLSICGTDEEPGLLGAACYGFFRSGARHP